ncbi:hypothetical protein ACLBKU_07820 [Erythrobacter sp. NE805]|uniref:hypothetical protein n=1 Tax=Erythrobacter sp. NE805 TaxID=3389875 RepID=UPI00396AFF6F
MPSALPLAAALLAALAQAGPAALPQRGPARLPAPAAPAKPEPPRIPIDLGWDAPTAEPPQQIDILASPPASEAASAAVLKECEDNREAGVVSGEIVVCREAAEDTSQSFSGSHEAWLKAYAERTKGPSTPDVDGSGLPYGMIPMITIKGCFIGPCPKDPALIIDVTAIETPPAGSDAERVGQGLTPREGDDAPVSDDAKRRIAAELGLPEASPTPRSP